MTSGMVTQPGKMPVRHGFTLPPARRACLGCLSMDDSELCPDCGGFTGLTGLAPGIGVPGSRMRAGGAYTDPANGLTIASDRWVQTRCMYCRTEAMTPIEMLPPGVPQARDGAFAMICGACMSDVQGGHRPGHNRHRRRRRHS
jgi:hypothetical protein